MAHVGTYEYWVEQAMARVAPGVPFEFEPYRIEVEAVPLHVLMAEQNRVLAEIDEAARAVPKAVIGFDPAVTTDEQLLQLGEGMALIAARTFAECVYVPPRWRELRRSILEERLDLVELELAVLPDENADQGDEAPAVWGRLLPTPLELAGSHSIRKAVRSARDLDVKTAMMRAFCWPTAVSPYGWPS